MVMGLVSGLSSANHSDSESFLGGARLVQPRWMPERRILGGGWTCGVSFWPFPNSSGWWRLISSVFLTRTSCCKTTHANSYYGAWPGWAVSISVLPLTVSGKKWRKQLIPWKKQKTETAKVHRTLSLFPSHLPSLCHLSILLIRKLLVFSLEVIGSC